MKDIITKINESNNKNFELLDKETKKQSFKKFNTFEDMISARELDEEHIKAIVKAVRVLTLEFGMNPKNMINFIDKWSQG